MRHLENDGLLKQLGYSINDGTIKQIKKIIENTEGFSHIERHLVPLNDELQKHKSYIAMSSSVDSFKIKNEAMSPEIREEVTEIIYKWANRYKIDLEKVKNRETYYIKGFLKP